MTDQISSKVQEGWTGPGRKDGNIVPLTKKDDALHTDPSAKNTFEWWYFDAHLDNGYIAIAFFHASNPNPGMAGKSGVELVLIRPDGQKTQHFVEYPQKDFQASTEFPDVKMGNNYLRVDYESGDLPIYEIFISENDLTFHLKFSALVKGWKPGNGYSRFGDMGSFAWVVPFARASVQGTIQDDHTKMQVKGVGYHDHNWLDFQFFKIIKYWMWGRVYSDSYTLSYAYIQCNKKMDHHAVKVLMLARNQDVILSSGEFDFLTDDFKYNGMAGHEYPNLLTIKAGEDLEAVLRVKQVKEAENMLDNFGPIPRFLAKNILRLKPGYFRLISDFTIKVKTAGHADEESGTTLHEIVAFKPIR
jgi:hypothetical protein